MFKQLIANKSLLLKVGLILYSMVVFLVLIVAQSNLIGTDEVGASYDCEAWCGQCGYTFVPCGAYCPSADQCGAASTVDLRTLNGYDMGNANQPASDGGHELTYNNDSQGNSAYWQNGQPIPGTNLTNNAIGHLDAGDSLVYADDGSIRVYDTRGTLQGSFSAQQYNDARATLNAIYQRAIGQPGEAGNPFAGCVIGNSSVAGGTIIIANDPTCSGLTIRRYSRPAPAGTTNGQCVGTGSNGSSFSGTAGTTYSAANVAGGCGECVQIDVQIGSATYGTAWYSGSCPGGSTPTPLCSGPNCGGNPGCVGPNCGGGPACGNGVMEVGEQCEPTLNPTGCATGFSCNASCACTPNNPNTIDMAVDKVALGGTGASYTIGDLVPFRIVITNTGNVPLTAVSFSDTFNSAFLRFINISGQRTGGTAMSLNSTASIDNISGRITIANLALGSMLGTLGVGQSYTININFIALAPTARTDNYITIVGQDATARTVTRSDNDWVRISNADTDL